MVMQRCTSSTFAAPHVSLALLAATFRAAFALHRELFTTNAICKPNYCVNPIFPGVEDLGRLESGKWKCSSRKQVVESLNFCSGVVDYNPALPLITGSSATVETLVQAQEKAATTAFAYHLSGMGLEVWDHTRPSESDNDCIKSIWKLACYTYFPKAEHGCAEGQESRYLRPCKSSCGNYVKSCAVECCDESVQCVFSHERPINKTAVVKTTGYASANGPSPYCTGAAAPSSHLQKWLLLAIALVHGLMNIGSLGSLNMNFKRTAFVSVLVIAALTAKGCDMDHQLDVPQHYVGNWRREPDYLIKYEFIPPGQSAGKAKLNSCQADVPLTLQCSGRGICKAWDPDNLGSPVTFCECNRDWADPECRTPRKSQMYAYILSLFLGFFGADQFYLGYAGYGVLKACTLGGVGVWWLIDVIRIGSAPVYAYPYRLAADLPHWIFVLTLVTFFLLVGFTLVGSATLQHRAQKRKDAMLMQAEEEARFMEEMRHQSPTQYAAPKRF